MSRSDTDAVSPAAVGAPVGIPRGPVPLAIAVSGVRCLLTYLVVPALAPALGASIAVALPLLLALYVLGIGASARAMWRSAETGRCGLAALSTALVTLNLVGLLATVS